jgi:hypothetical protein
MKKRFLLAGLTKDAFTQQNNLPKTQSLKDVTEPKTTNRHDQRGFNPSLKEGSKGE